MPFGLLMLAFAAVFAFSMFSFLNERNRSDFFHAIPKKRECVYVSFVLAILTWIFGILCVSAVLNATFYSFAEFYSVNFSVVIVTPLVLFLASAMIAAFMILAMTLTGTTVSNVLIFALLLLFGRTIGTIFVSCLRDLVPILGEGNGFFKYFEFQFSLPFALLSGDGYSSPALVVYTSVLTLFVFVLGGISYVIRRSETATKSAPSRFLQLVYRSAITLPFFLFVIYSFVTEDFEPSIQLVLLVLALLVYCIFELMTTKKIKTMLKALPMVVIPIALAIGFTGLLFFAKNCALSDLPKIEDVVGVSDNAVIRYSDPSYRELRTEETSLTSEEAKAIVLTALERDIEAVRAKGNYFTGDYVDGEWQSLYVRTYVKITLENGRTISRYIGFTEKEYDRFQTLMFESEQYLAAYFALPSSSETDSITITDGNFSAAEAKRLWASFVQEFYSLSDEEKLAYIETGYRGDSLTTLSVSGTYRLKSFRSTYVIRYEYMPKTAQMFLEMAVASGYVTDDLQIVERVRDKIEQLTTLEDVDFEIAMTELTGERAGKEYVMYALKAENSPTPEVVVQALDFIAEHGEFSYDPDRILVRFRIGLYNLYVYSVAEDAEVLSPYVSTKSYDEGFWVSELILSFTKEDWEDFIELILPYAYIY